MLKLEFPNETHKEMWEELINNLRERKETLAHPEGLFDYEKTNFEWVLQKIFDDENGIVPHRVPATTLFLIDSQRNMLLWAINIRHHINHPVLVYRWWHIGYWIRPSERKKWYATEMLKLGLIEARKLWIDKVLLTCKKENIASAKVIEKNGGVFESEQTDTSNGETFRRYWITL